MLLLLDTQILRKANSELEAFVTRVSQHKKIASGIASQD